jgi:hypothetical protein
MLQSANFQISINFSKACHGMPWIAINKIYQSGFKTIHKHLLLHFLLALTLGRGNQLNVGLSKYVIVLINKVQVLKD